MSLATTDAAIYSALSATQYTTTPGALTPFALVGRYAGELDGQTLCEVVAQWPCALLRFDGETETTSVDTVCGDLEVRGEASWTVIVGAEEPRELDDAVASTNTSVPGYLMLVDVVQSVLNGLALSTTDVWRWRRLRCVEVRPLLVRRGVVYVWGVRFTSSRTLPVVTMSDASVLIPEIRGEVVQAPSPSSLSVEFSADT